MRNIFILYMPPGNTEAMVHYEDTIRKKVSPDRILQYTPRDVTRKLQTTFGNRPIAVWGSRDSKVNRSRYDRMNEGDEILIVEGTTIRLMGRIAAKTVSPALSQELWKNLRGDTTAGWDLIYFIANPREIKVPFSKFNQIIGYKANWQLRGLTAVAKEKLEAFYERYDDLYSILVRVKEGQPVEKYKDPGEVHEKAEAPSYAAATKGEEVAEESLPSDHLHMQWLLLNMGIKAGEKVWAPRADQTRISSAYDFKAFEETFSAGLDTQAKFVENIDVVWKEEFRIDAAFEIENSTSIYSGLLRFADLTMVAPNTLYPMFIVAPSERRGRVMEQLGRPTFRHLHLAEKVRYLPYEAVKAVDEFFGESATGLSVKVFMDKSECLPA